MLDLLSPSYWTDPEITFFEPSCGNGNIVEVILRRRIAGLGCKRKAIETLIAIDICEENVRDTRERVLNIVGTECLETVHKNITQNDCLSALHEGFGLPKNMTKLGLEFVQKHGVKKINFN